MFTHGGISRIEKNVDELKCTVLHGKMKINATGVPSIQKQREKESQFIKYRNLFKLTSKILRRLDYNDQGLINANITKNKLGISSKDDEFAKEQGEILYNILEEIVDMPNIDQHFVEQKLQPIIDTYYEYYGDGSDREICNDQVIDDRIKDCYNLGIEIPRRTPFTDDELSLFFQNLYSQQLIDIEDDLDEEYEYFDDDTIERNENITVPFRYEVSSRCVSV